MSEFSLDTLLALSDLQPIDREILVDHHVLHRSMKEIGMDTGLTWQSVKERCRKGERLLRRALA